MKGSILFLAATLMLTAHTGFAKTLIVSDIDDTVKLTDVLNSKPEIIRNALLSKKAFSGMSTLYRELDKKDTIIHYVSGSPQIIKSIINNFLEYNQFPQETNVTLKRKSIETYEYKVEAIKHLIANHNPDEIILIGDDTEKDPEVYDTISKLNPRKVSGIYIRAIRNRAIPDNGLSRNFFSAVEIAGFEHLKGKLNTTAVTKVTDSFIRQDNKSELAIKNRYCPSQGRTELEEIKQQVRDQKTIEDMERTQTKIIKTCSV